MADATSTKAITERATEIEERLHDLCDDQEASRITIPALGVIIARLMVRRAKSNKVLSEVHMLNGLVIVMKMIAAEVRDATDRVGADHG